MKSVVLLTLLAGCASIPVNIRNYSGLTQKNVDQTYLWAQESFSSTTKCTPPSNKNVNIQTTNLIELNKGNNIFVPGGMAFRIGLYAPEIETIFVIAEHPSRERILFHEFLHFMFEQSPNCKWAAEKVDVQHTVISLMEIEHFKKHKMLIDIGDEWLLNALEAYGIVFRKK